MSSRRLPYQYTKGFEAGDVFDHVVPRNFAQRLPTLFVPGLYKIYLYAEYPSGRQNIEEIEFPTVDSAEDTPELDGEDVAQLVLAPCVEHNRSARSQIKYQTRWMVRQESGSASESWCAFWLNVALEEGGAQLQQLGTPGAMAPQDQGYPPGHMAPYGPPPGYGPGGGPLPYADQDANALLLSAVGRFLDGVTAWQGEMRIDLQAARQHADHSQGQLRDVTSGMMQYNSQQQRANQIGWDAYNRGLTMQESSRKEVSDARHEIEQLRHSLAQSGVHWDEEQGRWVSEENTHERVAQEQADKRAMIRTFAPFGIEALGQIVEGLGNKKAGRALKQAAGVAHSLLDDPDGDEDEDEDDDDFEVVDAEASPAPAPSVHPAAEEAAPPAHSGGDPRRIPAMREVATEDEIARSRSKDPMLGVVILSRMLGKSVDAAQRQAARDLLTNHEWRSLSGVLAARSAQECQMGIVSLSTSLGQAPERFEGLKSILTGQQWKLMHDIGAQVNAALRGANPRMAAKADRRRRRHQRQTPGPGRVAAPAAPAAAPPPDPSPAPAPRPPIITGPVVAAHAADLDDELPPPPPPRAAPAAESTGDGTPAPEDDPGDGEPTPPQPWPEGPPRHGWRRHQLVAFAENLGIEVSDETKKQLLKEIDRVQSKNDAS